MAPIERTIDHHGYILGHAARRPTIDGWEQRPHESHDQHPGRLWLNNGASHLFKEGVFTSASECRRCQAESGEFRLLPPLCPWQNRQNSPLRQLTPNGFRMSDRLTMQYSTAQAQGPLNQAGAYNSRANQRTNNKPDLGLSEIKL